MHLPELFSVPKSAVSKLIMEEIVRQQWTLQQEKKASVGKCTCKREGNDLQFAEALAL